MSFVCKICNKIYASYDSLWHHNNKFHNEKEKINTNAKCQYCGIFLLQNML